MPRARTREISEEQRAKRNAYAKAYAERKRAERLAAGEPMAVELTLSNEASPPSVAIPEPSPIMISALGRLAESIVGNQATDHAFHAVERSIMERWAASKPSARDEREDHYRDLLALRSLWQQLERFRADGRTEEIKQRKLRVA